MYDWFKIGRVEDVGTNGCHGCLQTERSLLFYLQPPVDTLDVVVMETGQHPQCLSVSVVAETDRSN